MLAQNNKPMLLLSGDRAAVGQLQQVAQDGCAGEPQGANCDIDARCVRQVRAQVGNDRAAERLSVQRAAGHDQDLE